LRSIKTDIALRIRDRFFGGELNVVVPELIFYEVSNAIRYNGVLSMEEKLEDFIQGIKVKKAFIDVVETPVKYEAPTGEFKVFKIKYGTGKNLFSVSRRKLYI